MYSVFRVLVHFSALIFTMQY